MSVVPTDAARRLIDEVRARKSGLTTLQLHALDRAVRTIVPTTWATYLVGTAQAGGPYRDVDVRTILDDEEFDAVFGTRPDLWEAWCFAVGSWLARATGLPVDYQVQRRTEANEKYQGGRNPVGRGRSLRQYAGGGDATRFITVPEDDA
jgi:hypothetical protein